jgi:hypothetical protein
LSGLITIAVAAGNPPAKDLADIWDTGLAVEALVDKLDDLNAKLHDLRSDAKLETKLMTTLRAFSAMQLEDWRPEVETRAPAGDAFMDTLKHYFDNQDSLQKGEDTVARCMVTNLQLPVSCVAAAHIIPWSKRRFARALLDMEDINAGGNGLLWCWPLEHAWADHKFAIRYSGDSRCNPRIHMHAGTCTCRL